MFNFFKNYKELYLLFIIVLSAFIILFFVTEFTDENSSSDTPKQNIITDTNDYTSDNEISQESNTTEYYITEYNGIIGVFKYGDTTPYLTENVKVELLPDIDKELIRKGVEFQNYKDMIEFLQDYE